MIGSEKVRAARKEGQLERHKIKKKHKGSEYAEWFAQQPKQLLKAKVNAEIVLAKQELADAIETLQIAEETGIELLAAQEAAHIASLYLAKLNESKQIRGSIALTTVEGAAT